MEDEVSWAGFWESIATALERHVSEGRGHLLTEDVLRFATALELQRRGVHPSRMIPEHQVPAVGGKIDLVVDDPPSIAIEFKFPRDPRSDMSSADTMTLGELMRDFYRIGKLAAPEGWVIQVVGDRLRGYLLRRNEVKWSMTPEEAIALHPEILTSLPRTASGVIPSWAHEMRLSAHCVEAHVFTTWTLVAYRIEIDAVDP